MTKRMIMTLALAAAFLLLPGMASACSYSVGSPNVAVAHSGGWVSVPIYTQPGCFWNALPGHAWITMSTSRGYGNGAIVFYVAPNSGRSARTSTVGETVGSTTLGGRSNYASWLFAINLVQY